MKTPTVIHQLSRLARSAAVIAMALVAGGTAGALFAQSEDEIRTEHRVQVIFTDDDSTEGLWAHSDEDGQFLISADGDKAIRAASLLYPRTHLGVHLLEITPELREHFGAAADAGILVSAIAEDSPAADAGIAVGDVLVAIGDSEITRASQVLRELAHRGEGETVTVGLVRDRRSLTVEATLAARPRPQVDLAPMFWTPGEDKRRVLRFPNRVLEIEKGDLDEAFSQLHERIESPEWKERLEETTSRRRTLENRIRELEERLREMEKRLEEDTE